MYTYIYVLLLLSLLLLTSTYYYYYYYFIINIIVYSIIMNSYYIKRKTILRCTCTLHTFFLRLPQYRIMKHYSALLSSGIGVICNGDKDL